MNNEIIRRMKDEETYKNTKRIMQLSFLELGETAIVVGISHECTGPQRRRLLDFGFVPGRRIKAVIKSAFGCTVGYSILGTTVGLRKQQTKLVLVERKNEKE